MVTKMTVTLWPFLSNGRSRSDHVIWGFACRYAGARPALPSAPPHVTTSGGACVLAVRAGYARLLLRAPGGSRVPFGRARGQRLLVEVARVVRYTDRYSDAWVERE